MLSWEDCPEAAGPQSEGVLYGKQYGDPGMPTIGRPPKIMSDEMRDRERAEADRRYEMHQAVERAAISAGQAALEAAATADRILSEARTAGSKAALR